MNTGVRLKSILADTSAEASLLKSNARDLVEDPVISDMVNLVLTPKRPHADSRVK